MTLKWRYALDGLDWEELADLYRVAPLGNKNSSGLKTVFTASMFKCFVYDAGKLIGAGRALADGVDCAYLCDVAVHPSHRGLQNGGEKVSPKTWPCPWSFARCARYWEPRNSLKCD